MTKDRVNKLSNLTPTLIRNFYEKETLISAHSVAAVQRLGAVKKREIVAYHTCNSNVIFAQWSKGVL